MSRVRTSLIVVALLAGAGCGDGDDGAQATASTGSGTTGSGGTGGGGGSGGEGATRPWALAASGAQLLLEPKPGIYLTEADLAADVDVVLVHQEFYGLPWDAFEAGQEPPAAWVAIMDDLAAHASAVGPVFLSLQLVSGPGRRFLANRTVVSGGDVSTEPSAVECFDFASAADGPSKRAAYAAYVDWMVRRFSPRWVNVAIEMNMFMSCGDDAWSALVDVERDAYDAAKAVDPAIVVFPSIQIEVLYGWSAGCTSGDRDACFDDAYAKLANVSRDRFAVTSFPYLLQGTPLQDPNDAAFGDDWLTRAGDRGGEETIVAETGWLASPMEVLFGTSCTPALPSSENAQLAWLEKVLATTKDRELELVTWASDRDLIPAAMMDDCPCTFDATWCAFLDAVRQSGGPTADGQAGAEFGIKMFGAMGLRHHDGTPRRALHGAWQAARQLPWAGPP